MKLTLEAKSALLGMLVAVLVVHKSLRKWA